MGQWCDCEAWQRWAWWWGYRQWVYRWWQRPVLLYLRGSSCPTLWPLYHTVPCYPLLCIFMGMPTGFLALLLWKVRQGSWRRRWCWPFLKYSINLNVVTFLELFVSSHAEKNNSVTNLWTRQDSYCCINTSVMALTGHRVNDWSMRVPLSFSLFLGQYFYTYLMFCYLDRHYFNS